MGFFTRKEKRLKKKPHKVIDIQKEMKRAETDESLWIKCSSCEGLLYKREVERNQHVCPKCFYHFPLTVENRIATIFDKGSFTELFSNIEPVDFLKFKDTKPYKTRLIETKESTKKTDAMICGKGKINGFEVYTAIFDFSFMGGSLGSVVGEKVTRILEEGLNQRLPVIIFCSSGGARMQEGIMSLMQMSKVSGAIYRLKSSRIPYITVLTDPTLGGVTASMGMLGDIIISEPKAMIGFAGPRVIKDTIKEELPQGFQRAEFLFEHGMIDMIIPRKELKQRLHAILSMIT
ncbi:MAG TPA: acetyl-CoA carboxylase, carboxyltransferase subunit beta [Syntrophorhabdus sp.]|jgi:acetyl-CoA carboxylase carboxyl transferase subunit beta|nr:acetyl-CoA carboxylase carboxyltransferase subunit beta [Syntrophorhabdus sp.]MDI9558874.1 acetyl-CoA carboxylase, carboxyltransferase subunit beta [Pseudomonadota bacterium]OPX95654.1 MAG: Acetyl-coenzyme A carboxylase carboxyl transferase subunit beta [Syntrophorhabdus sp. PtaB.Bin027]OQB74289.1 MAG: Acetyl-coenzyme A carboxylase carboxyl transferase subunit beta [Deltaproteobacteria bacterium ADurb.Bin135]MBP8743794.1 acetyl-CoA carboxylase carboxyltransferase subunit beta [Syntrophorhabd